MGKRVLFVMALLYALISPSVYAYADFWDREYMIDSIRFRLDCCQLMLDGGNLDGAIRQLYAVDGFMNSVRLKNNKKNEKLLLSYCSEINAAQGKLLSLLWSEKDYEKIQDLAYEQKIHSWREEITSGYSQSKNSNKYIRSKQTYPYSKDFTEHHSKNEAVEDPLLRQYMGALHEALSLSSELSSERTRKKTFPEEERQKENEYFRHNLVLGIMEHSRKILASPEALDAAELYWRFYEKFCVFLYSSESVYLKNMYEAKYGGTYGWDLTRIYGPMYSKLCEDLIKTLWLDESQVHSRSGVIDKGVYYGTKLINSLGSLDYELKLKWIKEYGTPSQYAEAISGKRPEQAFEITGDASYLERHKENLEKWYMTELEYQSKRTQFDSWDEFYSWAEGREKEYAYLYAQKQLRTRQREQENKQREQIRAHERETKDKAVLDEYKQSIAVAMTNRDYPEADRLAKEALNKMSGGDAYLYYVQAHVYYEKNLRFNLGVHENASEYFRAYRDEARRLVEMCNRSINLDSSSGNDAYFVRGIAYIVLGYTDSAISDFRRLTSRTDEKGVLSYYNIGVAAKNAQRWGQAIEAFKESRNRSDSEEMRLKCLTMIRECQEKLDKPIE